MDEDPGLIVYRSNRAEFLAELLATQLRLQPPPPFQTTEVVVNTWPTSRWLGEQLAVHLGGVAANLRFPFPAVQLRRLGEEVLAEDAPDTPDPWRASRLVWPLLELLPGLAETDAGEPLRRWLARHCDGRSLSLGTWQLARAIADAFDDYGLYRPRMLHAWEQGRDLLEGGDPLPANQLWQKELYLALRQRLGREPGGLRLERAIERLRQGETAPAADGPTLRLFGLSSLAPVQVRLLQALSGRRRVALYLLTPCDDLWQRAQDRRQQLREALEQPLDVEWLLRAPGLEARFGRLGAEFQQLLEGTGEAQLGVSQERDLFFLPASAVDHPGSAAPLLAQLQEQLVAPGRLEGLTLADGDHSLEFHPCPGPLRQVEIVRDRLLQLMAADPTLQPRDILVMTPQVDRFAPLVASVFGDSDATGVRLPWRLTDRSQQSQAGIGRTLLALLRLGGERLTASALEAVLECRPLQQRFDLSPEEIGRLNRTLQRCGFRWGLDGRERGGDPVHSLAWAIDRLLLALVLPERPGLALGDERGWTAPAPGGTELELSGRWLHLLTRLRHWLEVLGRGCGVGEWAERLRQLLTDLFGDGGEAAWELPPLLAAIDAWRRAAGDTPLELAAPVVAAVLDEELAVDSGRFGHRSGSLTISALEPMRAIPHRVIVLMGLDAGCFPRQRDRPAFHLLERQRRLGDPHPADQDRYVLLEALLSARSHLLISWSCRDERKGEALPPAGPVRQWLQWLEAELGEGALERLTVEHAASPLERRNFQPGGGRPPGSCDRRLLATRRRLDGAAPAPPRGLALAPATAPAPAPATAPEPAAAPSPRAAAAPAGEERFADLRDWLMAPQRQWLQQLGLRPREWLERLDDLEALELEERDRASLLRGPLAEGAAEPLAAADWLARNRGRGLLPAGAGGALEARRLERRWSSLQACLEQLGEPWQEGIGWGPWRAAPLWRGDTVVVVHTGKPGPGHQLDLWLQLQLAAAAAPGTGRHPRQGVLIAREDDALVPVQTLEAPTGEAGRAELERLAALREAWRDACWPLPPRTGWEWLRAERKTPGSGAAAARQAWEGREGARGERRDEEMVVCFGADLPLEALLDDDFGGRAAALYGALLPAPAPKARATPKTSAKSGPKASAKSRGTAGA